MNQRWNRGRDSYRLPDEVIDPRAYDVALLEGDNVPKAFVLAHHYSGTYPAARIRVGLYRGAELVGVAVFSHPCNDQVLTKVFPGPALESIELGRFVLADEVPGNGETWFLARCFEQLRAAGIRGVVSFSDPLPRTTSAGNLVFPGHVGTIYQAHNGRYLGRGTARTLRMLPGGQVLSDRTLQKLRKGERGWRYAAELLERAGAAPVPEDLEQRPAWLAAALQACTRTVRHPGNHKYAWNLERRRRLVLDCGAYPKAPDLPRAA